MNNEDIINDATIEEIKSAIKKAAKDLSRAERISDKTLSMSHDENFYTTIVCTSRNTSTQFFYSKDRIIKDKQIVIIPNSNGTVDCFIDSSMFDEVLKNFGISKE